MKPSKRGKACCESTDIQFLPRGQFDKCFQPTTLTIPPILTGGMQAFCEDCYLISLGPFLLISLLICQFTCNYD